MKQEKHKILNNSRHHYFILAYPHFYLGLYRKSDFEILQYPYLLYHARTESQQVFLFFVLYWLFVLYRFIFFILLLLLSLIILGNFNIFALIILIQTVCTNFENDYGVINMCIMD